MREQVLEARKRQQMRCRGAAMRENGRLSPGEILKYCPLGLEEQEFLEQASEQAGLSMRGSVWRGRLQIWKEKTGLV